MVEGLNDTGRERVILPYPGGELFLLTSEASDTDGETGITDKSIASTSTATSDWATSTDNTAGTTTLENSTTFEFPNVSTTDTINQVALQSVDDVDEFVIFNDPNDPSPDNGIEYQAGEITYTLGGE